MLPRSMNDERNDGRPDADRESSLHDAAPRFSALKLPTKKSGPYIIVEKGGELWFCQSRASSIGRLDIESGKCIEYPASTPDAFPVGIVEGADGAMWFAEQAANNVCRIGANGDIDIHAMPIAGSGPTGLILGEDGNVWFSLAEAGRIGRISPDGRFDDFGGPRPGSRPLSLVARDGAIWFSQIGAGSIGRLTYDGEYTEFKTPSTDSAPRALALHQDGSIWGVLTNANALVRIDRDGRMAEFGVPGPPASLRGVTVAPDGDVYFTANATNKIGRMTASGRLVGQYAIPGENCGARCIMCTEAGRIFFSGFDAGEIIELSSGESPATEVDRAGTPAR
jgi:virginiamycin B lyase